MSILFAIFTVFSVLALAQNAIASSCVIEHNKSPLTRTDNSPAGILKLLRDGEQLIELEEDDRHMVVFIGITGSGKTTLVLHVGSEDEDLVSRETRPHSREYVIDDKCNRTSSTARSLESFTLVPNRFIDPETNVTYFDMPGFSDTRPQVAYDIAATYFSKKVLDYARRIKLVLVVNHSHLKVGEDRKGFTELVEHVTRLVRNITKFDSGIALIATKVVNEYNPESLTDFPYVPDDVVIDGIADFLGNAKSLYQEQNRNKAVELIDILLHKTRGKYDRIGLFRRPDGPGPLDNVKSLKGSRQKLKTVIERNIFFTDKDTDDFGYTISEKSKNELHNLMEEARRNATNTIRALGSRVLDHFTSRENFAADLEEMISVFDLSAIQATEFQKICDFATYVVKYAEEAGINITEDDTKVLKANENHMNFLNHINGKNDTDWSSTIYEGMREVTEYIQYSQTWYISFLNEMDRIFSGYEMQRRKSKYNATSRAVLEQINQFVAGNEIINSSQLTRLSEFLQETGQESLFLQLTSYTINLNQKKLLVLSNILKNTLDCPDTKTYCQDKKMTVKGHYVLISQLEVSSCPDKQLVEILALEKIFIDTNLNLSGTALPVFMIAPTLVVTSQVEIALNGKDAPMHYPRVARSGIDSEFQSMRNGGHGLPGLPGGPAGHFVGIATKIINGDELTISAVGGDGGNGQDGGDGYRGRDGVTPREYEGNDVAWAFNVLWAGHVHNYEYNHYSSGFWRTVGWILAVAPDKEVDVHRIQGTRGFQGGNGGDGGSSGIGGHKGTIVLVDYLRNASIKSISEDGSNGLRGDGGNGAEGGKHGKNLLEKKTTEKYWWSNSKTSLSFYAFKDPTSYSADDGADGSTGDLSEIPREPPLQIPADFSTYKAFVDDNLNSCLHKGPLLELRRMLESDISRRLNTE